MQLKKYLFIFSFLLTLSLPAQKIKVFDLETHLPVSHVVVFSESENEMVQSDEDGIVNLSVFKDDEVLWFSHPAYKLYMLSRKADADKHIFISPKIFTIDEFVVSASRMEESKKRVPYVVETIKPRSIEFKNAATSADILTGSGYVSVQKSQGGGGSPILRGFEANRVLLVMDGVRMNNGIYRSGHLQNSITIDPNILEKTEVLFGPSSVIYGSDALGGVVSYFSKDPVLSNDTMVVITPEVAYQHMSASHSNKYHVNINAGFKNWASLSAFTYSKFGDITMGKNRKNSTNDWGKVFHYAQRINGNDSMMVNSDPYTQPNTGYEQYDVLQKFKYTSSKHTAVLNIQYSTSSNVDRFDQLNDYKGDYLKFAEYYYGPQERLFISANNNFKSNSKWFTQLNTIVAYQKVKESRNSRKFNNDSILSQFEDLDIYSVNFDFSKVFNDNAKLNYGAEFLINDMTSNAHETNIASGLISPATSRYPNGGSFFHSYSLYLNYNKKFSDQFSANTGLRYGYFRYESRFEETALFEPIKEKVVMKNKAPSASIGLVYLPSETWKIAAVTATGYRVPNVDDYGKIRAKNDEISQPNPFLKPEYAINTELSATKSFWNEGLVLNLTFFNTWLHDAIVRTFDTDLYADSILYDGDKYRVFINENAQKAIVRGVSAGVHIQPTHNLSLASTINYTEGKISSTGEPMGHITPLFGKVGGTYHYQRIKAEFYMQYQGEKKLADMSPYGEDNEDEAPQSGFPAWQTYNIAAQYQLLDKISLQASIENIFDLHYKAFASGISAPGRNFIFSITGRF